MQALCIIELDQKWFLTLKNVRVYPADAIEVALDRELNIKKLEYKSFTELAFYIDSAKLEDVKKVAIKCIKGKYKGTDDIDKIIKVYLANGKKEQPKQPEKKEKKKEDKPMGIDLGNGIDLEKALKDGFAKGGLSTTPPADKGSAPTPPPQEEKVEEIDPAKEILDKIDSLVGAREFKALCHEIAKVAPALKDSSTKRVFDHRCFLFAINEGAGLTTNIELLTDLLCVLELRKPTRTGARAMELDYVAYEDVKFMQEYDDFISKVGSARPVISIDISKYIQKTNTESFKKFLINLEKRGLFENTTFIFRVPFLNKETIDMIEYSLNDIVNVKSVCFPPLTATELKEYAVKEAGTYGYELLDEAWPSFQERIFEERADGKFYDLKTINKITRELIYNKQLDSAGKEKVSKKLTAKDTEKLCVYKPLDNASIDELFGSLVCGDEFKKKIDEIVAQVLISRKVEGAKTPCIHMSFVGNPGTGKTTLARIVGKVLKEKGILRIGNFFECSGRDLVGRFVGETAPKTSAICRDAYGSVLFIDEAYSLYRGRSDSNDFGREALDTLIAEMENHRDDFVVIMAGYTDEMKTMISGNAGLASRIPYTIEFPNFTREQLHIIFTKMINSVGVKYENGLLDEAKKYFDSLPEAMIKSKQFSNGRFVRNLYERTFAKACTRCQLNGIEVINIMIQDFVSACQDAEFLVQEKKPTTSRIGF